MMNTNLKHALRCTAFVSGLLCAAMMEPQVARADVEGYTEIDGYLFEDQWLADNVNETDYSPLMHANTLYLQLSAVVRKIEAFKLKDSYCLPPDRPLKSWDRDDLNDFVDDLKALDRWYGQLGPLAAMAPLSDESETYGVHAQLVSEVIGVKISSNFVKVYDMLLQLSSKPEVDCSPPPPRNTSAALDPEPDLLGALQSAQGGNPYRSRPEINLPLGEDPAELVREAEYQSDQRQRNVRQNERRLDRESRDRRAGEHHERYESPAPRNTESRTHNGPSSSSDAPVRTSQTETPVEESRDGVAVPSDTQPTHVPDSAETETRPSISTESREVTPTVLRIPSEPSISVPREVNVPAARTEVPVETPVVRTPVTLEVPNTAPYRSGTFETRVDANRHKNVELESRTEF